MEWDERLFLAINGLAGRSAASDWLMMELAKPGNLFYPLLLATVYWWWKNRRECLMGAVAVAAVVGATDALGTLLKGLVQRPRPCLTLPEAQKLLGCGGAFSFPSNHAANTAAAAAFFPDALSTVRLVELAPGVRDRLVACVHWRSFSDRCHRRMGIRRIGRRRCGVVPTWLASVSPCSRSSYSRLGFSGFQRIDFVTILFD